MLNKGKDNNEGTASFGEDTSMYSLVSEVNELKMHDYNDAGDKSKYSSDDSVEMENENVLKLGLLIIKGAEEEEDDDESKE